MRTMKRLAIAACVVLAGCSHGRIHYSAGATTAGTSFSGASVHVQAGGSAAAALAALGLAAFIAAGSETTSTRPFVTERGAPTADAPLAPDRKVNEQDCTRPIADGYANLKCR